MRAKLDKIKKTVGILYSICVQDTSPAVNDVDIKSLVISQIVPQVRA